MAKKQINKILEKKVFLVRNPFRKKKTDQYNIRALQIDDVLSLMQLAKKEVIDDISKVGETYFTPKQIDFIIKELKKRHLSTFDKSKGI